MNNNMVKLGNFFSRFIEHATIVLLASIMIYLVLAVIGIDVPIMVCMVGVTLLSITVILIPFGVVSALTVLRDTFRILIQFRKPYKGKLRSPIIIKKIM